MTQQNQEQTNPEMAALQQQVQAMQSVDQATIQYLGQQLGNEASKVGMLNGQLQLAQRSLQEERQRADQAEGELAGARAEIEHLQAQLDQLPTAAADTTEPGAAEEPPADQSQPGRAKPARNR